MAAQCHFFKSQKGANSWEKALHPLLLMIPLQS
jgi:hypothetical protein